MLADPEIVTAADVCRGVGRWLWRRGLSTLHEVPLANGRRADLMAIGRDGGLEIVEVKVSAADLRGDGKWPEYLDYCDRFWWAVPPALAALLDEARFAPEFAGLVVADRFEACELRPAVARTLIPARRRAATLVFARLAAARLQLAGDPRLADSR